MFYKAFCIDKHGNLTSTQCIPNGVKPLTYEEGITYEGRFWCCASLEDIYWYFDGSDDHYDIYEVDGDIDIDYMNHNDIRCKAEHEIVLKSMIIGNFVAGI
jgi:hypothetical protein